MAFTNTRRILAKLEDLLKCGVCRNLLSAPCTMGHCEHLFCRSCADKFLGSSCPTCGATASRIDPRPNEQLLAAVDICQRLSSLLVPRPVTENQLNDSAMAGNQFVEAVTTGSQPTENQPSHTPQIKPSISGSRLSENQPTSSTLQNESAVMSNQLSENLLNDCRSIEIVTVERDPSENQPSCSQQNLDQTQLIKTKESVTMDSQLSGSHLSGSQITKSLIVGSQINKTFTVENHLSDHDCSNVKDRSVATISFKEPFTDSAVAGNNRQRFVKRLITDIRPVESVSVGSLGERNDSRELMWSQVSGIQPLDHESAVDWSADVTLNSVSCTASTATSLSQIPAVNNIDNSINTTPGHGKLADSDLHSVSSSSDLEDEIPDTPPHGNSNHMINLNRSYSSQMVRPASISKLSACRSAKSRSLGLRRHIITPLKTSNAKNCMTKLRDNLGDGNSIECSVNQLPQSQNAVVVMDSETIDPTVQVTSDSNPEIVDSVVKCLPNTNQSRKSNVNEESVSNARIPKTSSLELPSVLPVEIDMTAITQQQQQQLKQRVSDKILTKLNHDNNNDDDQLCDVTGENSVDLLNSVGVGFVRSDCSESKILHHKSSSESSDDEVDETDFRRTESCMYGTGRQADGSPCVRVPGSGKEQGRAFDELDEQPSMVQDGMLKRQQKAAEDGVVLEDNDVLCTDDGVRDGAEDKLDVSMDAVEKDMDNCTELLQKTDPAEDELISISDGTEELWEDDKNVEEISDDKKQLDEDDEVEIVADEDLWKNVVDVLEGNDDANGKGLRKGNRNEDKVVGNSNKDVDVASDVTDELSLDDDEETQELEEIVGDIDREDVCVMEAERVSQVAVECVVEDLNKDLVRGTTAVEKTHEVVSDDTEELSQDDIVVQKKDNVQQERRDTEEEMVEITDGKEDVEKVAGETHVVVIPEAGERRKDDVLEKESKTVEEGTEKLVECAVENMEDEKDIDENILATCSSFVLQHPVHTYERHHLPGNKSVITENKCREKNVRSRILRVAPSRKWEDVDEIEVPKQKQEHLRTGKGRAGRNRSNGSSDKESDVSTLPTVIRPARPVAISRRCQSGEGQMEKVTSRVLDLFEEPQMQNAEEGPDKDTCKIADQDDILDICEARSIVPPHKKSKAIETKPTRRSDKDLKPDLSKHENCKQNVQKLSAQKLSAEQETSLETATDKSRRRSSGKNVVAEKSPETIFDALGISDDKMETDETKLSSAANVVSGAESNASNCHRSGQDKNTRPSLVRSVKRKSEEICGNEEISWNRKRIEIRQECNPDESAGKSSPQSISVNGTPRVATKSTPSSVRSITSVLTTSTVSSGKRSVSRRIQCKDLMSAEKSEMEFTTPTMPSRRKHSVVETPGSGCATPVEHSRSRKLSPSPARLFASSPSLKRNAKGETLLHLAAIKGDVEWVQTLLEAGFNTNVKDYANWTPLHEACNRGNVAIATLLLDYGALIDVPGGDNETSLHDAVTNGRVECVRLLVSRGASINARDRHGKTPVDLAWTDEMKVALRVPVKTQQHDQPLNPVARVEQEEELPVVMTTGLNKDERTLVQDCCRKLGWTLVEDFTSEVTHLVSSVNCDGSCRRTIKFLESILAGLWIVDVKWIKECERLKTRVCESEFEASGSTLSPGTMAPLKARQNKDKQLPGLFDGCRFYFHGEFRPPIPPREDLIRLVRQGGGVVVTREPRLEVIEHSEFIVPYHADRDSALADCSHYIVSSSVDCVQLVDGRQLARVPPSWIMTCIAAFRLVDQL